MNPPQGAAPETVPPKSLRRAIRDLIHCQFVAFLALWLAVVAPMVCNYHGLLFLLPGVENNSVHSHGAAHGGETHSPQPGHDTGSRAGIEGGALVLALPVELSFWPAPRTHPLPLESIQMPRQPDPSPLEQPPRAL